MEVYSFEEMKKKMFELKRELRFIETKMIAIIFASTWLLYIGLTFLFRIELSSQFQIIIVVLPFLNAFVWLFWGFTFLSFSMQHDVNDTIDKLKYTIANKSRLLRIIQFLIAIQFAFLAIIISLAALPTYFF